MKANRIIAAACLAVLPGLAGCLADGPAGFDRSASPGAAQPRTASWRCDGGTTMQVENLGSQIKVRSPRGLDLTLPASPPGQYTRYGEPPYALVFDGREALWFVTGKAPLNCRR
ncbi:MAG: hypothetical protein KDJ74_07675 [Notoacmeibacter sp.]|nr:hypothetical protein [Notoacmeibacter sp.]